MVSHSVALDWAHALHLLCLDCCASDGDNYAAADWVLFGPLGEQTGLIGLAYFKDIAFFFLSGYEKIAKTVTIVVSIVIVYLLDFSINIVQASSRALIIDMVPFVQQDLANAWASRMIGIFNVVGYLNGYLNLPKIAPVLGNTEFKALSLIGSIVLVVCTAITFFTAKEKRYFVQRQFILLILSI
ncbi:hypothetical protein MERGE_001256 [Pneumocystis wakefieldiae]|uniref:Autophagy-related protein n=1 Tax=Pneumocystis wakefieldiae TaxID=38082 RepID=A0A899G638_9ASCO|nr:hypothetical protein MERGE_001256 [Pneumocystis wakefieldiae]